MGSQRSTEADEDVIQFSAFGHKVLDKLESRPDSSARWKVRASLGSVRFILWEPSRFNSNPLNILHQLLIFSVLVEAVKRPNDRRNRKDSSNCDYKTPCKHTVSESSD